MVFYPAHVFHAVHLPHNIVVNIKFAVHKSRCHVTFDLYNIADEDPGMDWAETFGNYCDT